MKLKLNINNTEIYLSTLMKEGKKSYFTNYFQNNLNDLKSTWKGIKNLISLKELPM